jgi:hypothetical protein
MSDRTAIPGYEVLIADTEALLRALPIEPGRVRSRRLLKCAALTVLGVAISNAVTARRGTRVTVDDPWGIGRRLEWATSCPPSRHNFTLIPRIRSESSGFALHHHEAGIPIGVGPLKNAPNQAIIARSGGKVH